MYAVALLFVMSEVAAQAGELNFRDRQAMVINNAASYLELSHFHFQNEVGERRDQLTENLSWKNVSQKAITAMEVVILEYDPFNRPMAGGGRWLITGHNSGDWTPLMPGETSSDGLISDDVEPVFTAIAYVRAIRFQDGSVWTADISQVQKDIRQKLPVLRDLGDVNPSIDQSRKK